MGAGNFKHENAFTIFYREKKTSSSKIMKKKKIRDCMEEIFFAA